jgi:hypothetical protein
VRLLRKSVAYNQDSMPKNLRLLKKGVRNVIKSYVDLLVDLRERGLASVRLIVTHAKGSRQL